MTGVVRTRELAVFRWIFFSLLLLGMATTFFGITIIVLFEASQSKNFYEGLLLIGLVCFCSGGIGLTAAQVIQRGHSVRIMRGCCTLIIALLLLWLVYVWLLAEYGSAYRLLSFLSPLAICSVTTAMVVIAAYILSLETKSQEIQIGKRVVVCLLLICTVVSYTIIWFDELTQFDFLTIGLVFGWVVTILGLAAISLAVRRENKPRGKLIRTIPKRVKMKMTCPQCQQWLEAPSGPARCEDCGLRLIIEIQEPRCPCGYLLYELKGNVCPECGRVIEQRESLNTPHSTSE